jgi:hypothetical protein
MQMRCAAYSCAAGMPLRSCARHLDSCPCTYGETAHGARRVRAVPLQEET